MEGQIDTIQTKDGVKYKIDHQLFVKYSGFYKTMVEESTEEVFELFTIDSKQFDYIYEFMQLHKAEEPKAVGKVFPGVKLTSVMEDQDAELISRIFSEQPEQVKAVIDAAFFLHVNDLLKRLAAGMISSLEKQETAELVKESKKSKLLREEEVSEEIHNKINLILFTPII